MKMIAIVRLKIKIPDEMTDKEYTDMIKKYIDIYPPKSFRFTKYPDSLGAWF